ncbi:MAG: hypothetical protein NDP13_05045 [Crenarchaeota archaeon]|nr:hypothetical protein [Thermoproteota archaeon]
MYNVATVLHDIAYELGAIYFFPYVRLIYKANEKKDILFSCFTSTLTKDPLTTILLAREASLVKVQQVEEITNAITDFSYNLNAIFEDIKSVYLSARALVEGHRSDFLDEMNLNISWSRCRAILVPSAKLLDRTRPIFRYLLGNFSASKFSVASFVKFLIEEGLGITEDVLNKHIDIVQEEIVWYPVLIGKNGHIYEPAWKLEESVIFEWLVQNNEFFKFLVGELKRRER